MRPTLRDDFDAKKEPKSEESPVLKEIANRIKHLSYRDMSRLADLIDKSEYDFTVDCLLDAADKIEGKA